jgi:hypothetical protein
MPLFFSWAGLSTLALGSPYMFQQEEILYTEGVKEVFECAKSELDKKLLVKLST